MRISGLNISESTPFAVAGEFIELVYSNIYLSSTSVTKCSYRPAKFGRCNFDSL